MNRPPRKNRAIKRDDFWSDSSLVAVYTILSELERKTRVEWHEKCLTVRLILASGLRVSEAVALDIEDCSPNGVIQVRCGKGGKYRMVRVIPEFEPYLRMRLKNRGQGPFLTRENGERTSRHLLRHWWDEIVNKIQNNAYRMGGEPIPYISLHGGRHTYASHELAWKRLVPHEVQAQLGHSSVDMTLGVYTHVMTESMYQKDPPQWWGVAKGIK